MKATRNNVPRLTISHIKLIDVSRDSAPRPPNVRMPFFGSLHPREVGQKRLVSNGCTQFCLNLTLWKDWPRRVISIKTSRVRWVMYEEQFYLKCHHLPAMISLLRIQLVRTELSVRVYRCKEAVAGLNDPLKCIEILRTTLGADVHRGGQFNRTGVHAIFYNACSLRS